MLPLGIGGIQFRSGDRPTWGEWDPPSMDREIRRAGIVITVSHCQGTYLYRHKTYIAVSILEASPYAVTCFHNERVKTRTLRDGRIYKGISVEARKLWIEP